MIVQRRGSCSCRKVSWSSWRRAEKVRRRADADHVYFCPEAGGYHVTSWTRSDFDRITASRCPQGGDKPGDILGARGGRENCTYQAGDNPGASPATSPAKRVGILLVGPEDGTQVRKCGGPTPDRADRQRSPNETRPRRESEVTVADVARPEPLPERDTPPDLRPDPDDVRPWDGWEDDDYERAS